MQRADDSSTSDLEALERFVVENDDLLALEEAIGRFNIFDALRIERAEIRHSNFLAWLLSPNESHGQGDLFLKAVLMDLLRRARAEGQTPPVSPVLLDGTELHDIEIRREWKNIDLLIVSHEPAFVVAIENKVDAGEHSNQLNRYEEIVRTAFASIPSLFVFLSARGQETEDEDWLDYSYQSLHGVLSRVRRTSAGSLGADVATFLDHYLSLIGSRFMDDTKIEELCRRIYSNHRRAIDLIWQHAPSSSSEAVDAMLNTIDESPDRWRVRSRGAKMAQFVPANWVGRITTRDFKRTPMSICDLYIEIESWNHTAFARLVVGPGDDAALREQLIRSLMSPPHSLRLKGRNIREKWTRLGSTRLVTWGSDDDVPVEEIKAAFDRWLAEKAGTFDAIVPLCLRESQQDA